jgi:nitric oxide dioxygenase
MTPQQVAQVQQSFAFVAPIAGEAAALFYDRLFEIAPQLRPLFRGDRVRRDHYRPVGLALLWTLERSLGPQWTPDLAAAWTAAYTTLSDYMIGEAYGRSEVA